MRYVGIDEAGYGPNLGPMVMVAVIVEAEEVRRPDVWGDLPATVGRAGSPGDRLWVDDSKALYSGGKGRDRLEAAALALLAATGAAAPSRLSAWLAATGAGSLEDAELTPWLDPGEDPPVPIDAARARLDRAISARPFAAAPWRVVAVRAEVVGPRRFNADLARWGTKAAAHFAAFARLLGPIWEQAGPGSATRVHADKHGGRHFYRAPLAGAFPGVRIDPGEEGPERSEYTFHDAATARGLELALAPRADAQDGLVALASITAKALREAWMDAFNRHWTARVPGLRPTAGYPVDAIRFRAAIEPLCQRRGLDPSLWWRAR